jgi:hypothetical protein
LPARLSNNCADSVSARPNASIAATAKDREHRTQWQPAAELLLEESDVAAFSKQVELVLFMEAKLVLTQ